MTERMRRVNEALREVLSEEIGGLKDPRIGFVRDSFVAMALVLDLMAATGEPLSHLVDELPRYAMIKRRQNVAVDGPPIEVQLDRLAAAFPDAQADRRDGLRLDWPGRWAHIRASNTEPIIRIITEASDTAAAEALAETIGQRFAEALP